MRKIVDVVIQLLHDQLLLERRLFLMALDGGLSLANFLCALEGDAVSQILVAKSPKALAKQSAQLSVLLAWEAELTDIEWENEDLAQLKRGRLVKIFDGHEFIRRHGQELDLAHASLRGAQLQGADLRGANLEDCDLQGANLERINAKGASFVGANLQGCNLTEANLIGVDLTNADLRRANLRLAELRKATLNGTSLRGAELWNANMWEVDVSSSYLEGVDLSRADRRGS